MDTLTFRITLSAAKTQWDVMGNLAGGSTGVVHEAAFEAGMNEGRTSTNYGTIDNPLVSYGVYNMTAWESDVLYFYTLNENNYAAGDFRITKLRYDVIEDQSITIDEFKAGRLDVAGVGGQYYDEFKYSLNLKLSPVTTFFRFAFNVAGSEAYALNPILTQAEFRQAFYYAIDRETFTTDVRDPSVPTFGFLGPVYYSTEYNSFSYRSSEAGSDLLDLWSPDTFGYDPVQAKTLFDSAYAAAIAAGDIQDGEVVSVEYKFYDVETNWQIAEWVKDTVESIFNTGETAPIFELELAGVSSAALNDAWDNGDFEMTFGGWTGLDFNAPSMLGQVYNSSKAYMLEVGFDTAGAEVTATLPNTKVALQGWADAVELAYPEFFVLYDAYMAIVDPTETETSDYEAAVALLLEGQVPADSELDSYEAWVAVLALFVGDDLTCTYDDLFNYAYGEFYNVNDVNYAGKDDDFDEITATLEAELLDQMIAIPLFSSVNTAVYSNRVVFEADSYHARMAWGGMKYMYIGTEVTE
jgi:oligopeptide transport system substrate-binding protein